MNSQDAFCAASDPCAATASENPPSAGKRPAGPAGSGATARQSTTLDVFGSTSVG